MAKRHKLRPQPRSKQDVVMLHVYDAGNHATAETASVALKAAGYKNATRGHASAVLCSLVTKGYLKRTYRDADGYYMYAATKPPYTMPSTKQGLTPETPLGKPPVTGRNLDLLQNLRQTLDNLKAVLGDTRRANQGIGEESMRLMVQLDNLDANFTEAAGYIEKAQAVIAELEVQGTPNQTNQDALANLEVAMAALRRHFGASQP